jgi:hypothetical protein
MRKVESILYDKYVLSEKLISDKASLKPNEQSYTITITIGGNKQVEAVETFKYTTISSPTISAEDQWKQVQAALNYIQTVYKAKISVVEG